MAPRAESPAELRALDGQLAAIAPGPHLERRILGRLRGEPVRGRGIERARRPAFLLSFALAAAVAVLLGMEARDGGAPPKGAAGPSAPEGRDSLKEGAPAADSREPSAPIEPARDDERRPPRLMEEREEWPRRGAPNEMRPDFREPARRRGPRFWDAPDPAESPKVFNFNIDSHGNPAALEGGPRGTRQSDPWGISPGGGYGSMLYPQGARADELEPRSIRLLGPRRSSPPSPSEPGAPSPSKNPPATSWEPAEEPAPTCESYSTWKSLAHAECEADGLVLTDLRLLDECGDGMFGGVEAVCAGPANESEPGPGYCEGMIVGDGTTCEPPEILKLFAEKSCLAEGLSLADIYLHEDCEGGFSSMAKVLCCSEVAPPEADPPPSPCVSFDMKPACTPASEVEAEAKAQCQSKDLFVTEMKMSADCGNGGVSYAAILCCP